MSGWTILTTNVSSSKLIWVRWRQPRKKEEITYGAGYRFAFLSAVSIFLLHSSSFVRTECVRTETAARTPVSLNHPTRTNFLSPCCFPSFLFPFFLFLFSFFLFPSFAQAQRHGDRIRQNCHFNAFQVIAPVTVWRTRLSFKRKTVTRVIASAYCAFHPLAPHRKLIALKSTPRLAAFPSPLTVVSSMFDRYGPYASLFAYSVIHIISFFLFLFHCFVQPQKLHGKQSRIARLSLVIFRSRHTHTSHR